MYLLNFFSLFLVGGVPLMTMGVWQAELRNGGALDAAQRKFLRETYSSAGREEVV